ncbi:MAG: hypothetical protein P8J45_06480 [Phycisphaerales bacterium]|jgi:hypothetical protein|nr:hypothetical protein [Phycisphaerales bacterium]
MTTLRTVTTLAFLLAALTGCKPSAKTSEAAPLITPPAEDGSRSTLQLDPSKPIVIAGWWDNGRYLMEIEYDHRYRILDGPFPDSSVIERGRWNQKNHFIFTLEPYEASTNENEQVVLSLDRGRPIASIKGLAPFRKMDKAPGKIQKMLEGTWSDGDLVLTLRPEGQFMLGKDGEDQTTDGSWSLEQLKSIGSGDGLPSYELGALILEPEGEAVDPMIFTLERRTRDTFDFVLIGETGLLRQKAAANDGTRTESPDGP